MAIKKEQKKNNGQVQPKDKKTKQFRQKSISVNKQINYFLRLYSKAGDNILFKALLENLIKNKKQKMIEFSDVLNAVGVDLYKSEFIPEWSRFLEKKTVLQHIKNNKRRANVHLMYLIEQTDNIQRTKKERQINHQQQYKVDVGVKKNMEEMNSETQQRKDQIAIEDNNVQQMKQKRRNRRQGRLTIKNSQNQKKSAHQDFNNKEDQLKLHEQSDPVDWILSHQDYYGNLDQSF